ncbi:hypothetical protein D3C79_887970 [compost metagenome]
MNTPALWSLNAADTARLSISRPSQPESPSCSSRRLKMYKWATCWSRSVSHSSCSGGPATSPSACNCWRMRLDIAGCALDGLNNRMPWSRSPLPTYRRLTCWALR